MTTAKPFTINVPDRELDDLKQRLALTRFPDELDDAAWKYGAPLADVRRLAEYWRDGYDWRAHEAAINAAMLQFSAAIPVAGFGTLDIHFVHKRSQVVGAIPLLFVHGCEYNMPVLYVFLIPYLLQGQARSWRWPRSSRSGQTRVRRARASTWSRSASPDTASRRRRLSRGFILPSLQRSATT
jgi:hypothetical protein